MRILLVSQRFAPSVGGVETVTRLLGEALAAAGNSVRVVTNEHCDEHTPEGAVLRCPGVFQLIREFRIAEAVVLQGPTLRLGWPLMWIRKRAVMVHHTALAHCRSDKGFWPRERLARRVRHAAVSKALARSIPWPVEAVLPDPYDEKIFRWQGGATREFDLAFVGRLVPEKGARILIEAVSILLRSGTVLTASIIGDGPERSRVAQEISTRGLAQQIALRGQVTGRELARLLNRHRVLVVPSLCAEGFGLVALEGIACGCVVVGSRTGGLAEAIGLCGTTFAAGDAESLAGALSHLLASSHEMARLQAGADQHLARHRPESVARRYLDFIARDHQMEGMAGDSAAGGNGARAQSARCALS